ncbi:unnamed protein product, partial [Polarella glacialis]
TFASLLSASPQFLPHRCCRPRCLASDEPFSRMGLEDIQIFKFCGCCLCCGLTIFAIVAMAVSFKSMEQGKYGIPFYWQSQSIGAEVVAKPGMMFVGLGNELFFYPSTFQTMYFVTGTQGIGGISDDVEDVSRPIIRSPIRARSADGLEMIMSVSFQWRLEPQSLIPLYTILGETMYRDEFVRFAQAALIQACTYFPADTFFTNRNNITNSMMEVLTASFQQPELGLQAEIQGLQLREVDLPDAFDKEIASTQEQMQEVEVAMADRDRETIAMERKQIVATEKVLEMLQGAAAAAEKVRLDNEAQREQLLIYQERQAASNAEILAKFAGDPDPFTRLFDLMKIRAFDGHDSSHMMVNM